MIFLIRLSDTSVGDTKLSVSVEWRSQFFRQQTASSKCKHLTLHIININIMLSHLNVFSSAFHTLRCFSMLTPTLSGFEILNDATLIIQNWLLSRLFANIFDQRLIVEHKWQEQMTVLEKWTFEYSRGTFCDDVIYRYDSFWWKLKTSWL